jgi:hypothetical protein|mmetsp:Transcript_8611/g.15624  ORF Transcript_8611/g.15624 Transcript_8611/m.15624 type:complete len:81 (-) Transcript_8611:95-337(-)
MVSDKLSPLLSLIPQVSHLYRSIVIQPTATTYVSNNADRGIVPLQKLVELHIGRQAVHLLGGHHINRDLVTYASVCFQML